MGCAERCLESRKLRCSSCKRISVTGTVQWQERSMETKARVFLFEALSATWLIWSVRVSIDYPSESSRKGVWACPWGVILISLWERFYCEWGQHHFILWVLGWLRKKETQQHWALLLLPECRLSVRSCLNSLLPSLPTVMGCPLEVWAAVNFSWSSCFSWLANTQGFMYCLVRSHWGVECGPTGALSLDSVYFQASVHPQSS